jgi:hypothetical protein
VSGLPVACHYFLHFSITQAIYDFAADFIAGGDIDNNLFASIQTRNVMPVIADDERRLLPIAIQVILFRRQPLSRPLYRKFLGQLRDLDEGRRDEGWRDEGGATLGDDETPAISAFSCKEALSADIGYSFTLSGGFRGLFPY